MKLLAPTLAHEFATEIDIWTCVAFLNYVHPSNHICYQ